MQTQDQVFESVSKQIKLSGWAVSEDLFPSEFWTALTHLSAVSRLSPAGTGRGQDFKANSVRGDQIAWLDPSSGNEKIVLGALDVFRAQINRHLILNLHDVEAHLASYAPGQGYGRHVDSFRRGNTRRLSMVCYFNENWEDAEGGALRLHLPTGPKDVFPVMGRTALFLSDEIEHEVLPATRDRWSLAAWFRSRD